MSPDRPPIDILLVEDSETDAAMTEYRLRKSEHSMTIHHVESGELCMEYLRDPDINYPDLIILDLNMPKMDGREVLGEMRVDPDLHSITTVVMSSSDLDSDKTRAAELGANSYVVKPAQAGDFEKVMGVFDSYWLSMHRFAKKRSKTLK